ncbi:MAG: hypothetical protein ACXAEJ_07330 [Candidatus Thorarchaeota archaeon]
MDEGRLFKSLRERIIISILIRSGQILMNIIRKKRSSGTINEIKKRIMRQKQDRDLSFEFGRTSREILSKLLVVCGKVGKDNITIYEQKAQEINAEFIPETGSSWVLTRKTIQEHYDRDKHEGVLLIGTNKQLPATQIEYQGVYSFTDWFIQDIYGDGIPDIPVGRVFGPPETVTYHMDPFIVDSDIAIVFDTQPGRSTRHVEGLVKLGFDVEVLAKFKPEDSQLLGIAEFILQFSDGVFTSRIHGTPDKWATHNSTILSSEQTAGIDFKGYPVVYSEACSTAQEGPLLKAFLNQGACYIGATLDTINNIEPFDDWRLCPYADGWKFGFLDLLDTYPLIGQVKLGVDQGLTEKLDRKIMNEIDVIRSGDTTHLESEQATSIVEWVLFGNPLRRTTVGPNANYSPGQLIVDT